MSHQFRKLHVHILPITDRFHYNSTLASCWKINLTVCPGYCYYYYSRVWASDVGSSWMIYGIQWCAFNHSVFLSETIGHMWCSFVWIPCTAKCAPRVSTGKHCTDRLQRSLLYGQLLGNSPLALPHGYWRFCVVWHNFFFIIIIKNESAVRG